MLKRGCGILYKRWGGRNEIKMTTRAPRRSFLAASAVAKNKEGCGHQDRSPLVRQFAELNAALAFTGTIAKPAAGR